MPTLEDFKGKKYKTLDGDNAEIVHVSVGRYPVLIVEGDGEEQRAVWLTADLRNRVRDSEPYLHEVTPYDDWPIGCPVICRDDDKDRWVLREYSGLNDYGRPTAWANETTKLRLPWKEMRRVYE